MKILRFIVDTWFTGLIAITAVGGYLFYGLLFFVRTLGLKKFISLLVLLVLLVTAVAGTLVYYLEPFNEPTSPVFITVESGSTIRDLAEKLESANVIKSADAFVYLIKFKKTGRKLRSGIITFYKNEGTFTASDRISEAKAVEVKVKIIEGETIWQTASSIKKSFPIDSSKFIKLCRDTQFLSSIGISEKTAEGYLFPETYLFPKNFNEKDIIKRLVREFFKVYNSFDKANGYPAKLSMSQIVTMASIVEKEAKVPFERAHIAGVFYNRLKKNWPLGADPTVRYAIRKFTGPLRVSELRNPSPYNTRVHTGLPPAPICSPGRGALDAALHPLDTDDYFFVAKWDGSGEHDFSKTNYEHVRKKMKIRRTNNVWK